MEKRLITCESSRNENLEGNGPLRIFSSAGKKTTRSTVGRIIWSFSLFKCAVTGEVTIAGAGHLPLLTLPFSACVYVDCYLMTVARGNPNKRSVVHFDSIFLYTLNVDDDAPGS